jgi:hypothetical protein
MLSMPVQGTSMGYQSASTVRGLASRQWNRIPIGSWQDAVQAAIWAAIWRGVVAGLDVAPVGQVVTHIPHATQSSTE